MNLRVVGDALRDFREKNTSMLPLDTNIDTDTEAHGFAGEHTDDDSITLHMPNGDKWRITMEKVT